MNFAMYSAGPMMSQEFMNPLLSIPYQHYESPRKIDSSGYGSSSTASTVSPPSISGGNKSSKSDGGSSGAGGLGKPGVEARTKRYFCDVCQIAFPSSSVLENHVTGSRHNRRLKSQQQQSQHQQQQQQQQQQQHLQKQAQHEGSAGSVRCEICQVTVNSSQQLQAHLEGNLTPRAPSSSRDMVVKTSFRPVEG